MRTTNIVFLGTGGNGAVKASLVLAEALLAAGFDVKQSEIHGMSQRGGSVSSDVRFGDQVYSPMVAPGCADFVVVLDIDHAEHVYYWLVPDGRVISVDMVTNNLARPPFGFNVAMLGVLSVFLPGRIIDEIWHKAIKRAFKPTTHQANIEAFARGQEIGRRL